MACDRRVPKCMYEASGELVCGGRTQHNGMLDILSEKEKETGGRPPQSTLPLSPSACASIDMADVVNGRYSNKFVESFAGAPLTDDYSLGVVAPWHAQQNDGRFSTM